MRLIQDWQAYNDSLLFKSTEEYFKNAGKEAFSNEGKDKKHVVPNEMTNSIAHARSLANFVKENLVNYPAHEKIKILEIGSGAGIFAKHFLICAREMNFIDRIEFLVTEYSRISLEQIKISNILKDFKENSNYKFVLLDILNPNQAKDLNGNKYEINNISVSIMNYILCVLPLTLIRKTPEGDLQELFLRFHEKEGTPQDLNYLENLIQEQEWRNYDFNKETDLEKKYFRILEQHLDNHNEGFSFYSYGSLAVIDNILEFSNENAFIFVAEMPNLINAALPYKIYANSIAHPINDGLISTLINSKNLEIIRSIDQHYPLMRMFIMKNPENLKSFVQQFEQEYIEKNDSNLIIELRGMISQFTSKYSCETMKALIDKLIKIDKYSYETKLLLARYYFLANDLEQSRIAYLEAKNLDYLGNLEIHSGPLKKILELEHEAA